MEDQNVHAFCPSSWPIIPCCICGKPATDMARKFIRDFDNDSEGYEAYKADSDKMAYCDKCNPAKKYITIDETIKIIKNFGGVNTPENILKICRENKLGKMTEDGYVVDRKLLNRFLDGLAQ